MVNALEVYVVSLNIYTRETPCRRCQEGKERNTSSPQGTQAWAKTSVRDQGRGKAWRPAMGDTEATLRMDLRGGWRQTRCLCVVVYRGPSLPAVAKIASITKDGEDSPNPTSREHQFY